MLEALTNLRREVDAILASIRERRRVYCTDPQVLERIQELFLSWMTDSRPQLLANKVPPEVVSAADTAMSELVRLTAERSRSTRYIARLQNTRRILVQQVLLEVAKLPVQVPAPANTRVLPEIPDLANELIPNALLGWVKPMRDFLRDHAFDRNVFIMVAYRGHLAKLVKRIKAELLGLGLNAVVAKDQRLTDDLHNPIACLLCCNYGVAIFDKAEPKQTHNPNVVYELGMMQLLKRQCVILKHKKLPKMPSDLLARLYEAYASEDEAASKLRDWWKTISKQ